MITVNCNISSFYQGIIINLILGITMTPQSVNIQVNSIITCVELFDLFEQNNISDDEFSKEVTAENMEHLQVS